MRRAAPFVAIFLIQAVCAFFFVSDILSSVVGFRSTPISWEMREALEIGAAIGLILGVVVGGLISATLLTLFRPRPPCAAALGSKGYGSSRLPKC